MRVFGLSGFVTRLQALPFLVGALVGDGLVFLAVRLARLRMLLVISALVLVVAGLLLSSNLWARLMGAPGLLPWEIPIVIERFAFGLLLGFGGLILQTVVLPGPGSPQTRDEAVEQRRGLVRAALIVGGIALAFLVAGFLIFGFSVLVVYLARLFG